MKKLLILVGLLCCFQIFAQELDNGGALQDPKGSDVLSYAGNNSGQESIDPYSGTLTLKYLDISIPVSKRLSLDVHRVYNANEYTSFRIIYE